jgi:hypothetical protein
VMTVMPVAKHPSALRNSEGLTVMRRVRATDRIR